MTESAPPVRLSDLARPRPGPGVGAAYLDGLNPEQTQAVLAIDGPVLVLAGAGTGKTRVLTARLAHILAIGAARPWEILAVTFTNKAAREMRSRTADLVGPSAEGLRWLGTFHAVAAQILRRHAELAGLKPSFTILDVDDQERLARQLIEAEGLDAKRWTPRSFAALVDQWKNRGLTPDRLPDSETEFGGGKGRALYAAYQARLLALNACDFGDLLLHNLTLFTTRPDVLAEMHGRFRYILVDEYQDTNTAQYLWLRLLASQRRNLCCVGDDDQSIYGWRGAEVDNILRFERDFPGAQVIRLERNYRSTPQILAAASGLIRANRSRLGKTLWTEAKAGEKVRVAGVWDGEAEARMVADALEAWRRTGRRFSEAAVLVRASFQMRAFEERFVMLQIPYTVVGGPRFFERAEIRDAHAYLRLVQSQDDDLAFERVVNTPKRGLGEASVQKVLATARRAGVSAMAAARELIGTDELPARARTALSAFIRDLDRWRAQAAGTAHTRLAETVLEESGYVDMWRADRATGPARLDNLKELIQSMGAFDALSDYLEHVSLVMDLDRDQGEDAVQIMTLHSAKGLEFPLVFLPGWEEGVFPSQRSMDEKGEKGLEEERRLAYVGLTRAREMAQVSFAANRLVYGRWTTQMPSRFVDELPHDAVEAAADTGYYDGGPGMRPAQSRWDQADSFASGYESPGWRRAQDFLRQGGGGPAGRAPAIDAPSKLVAVSEPSAAGTFAVGDKVFHQKFGYGRIRLVEGNKLTVGFDKAGEKKVIDSFVEPA